MTNINKLVHQEIDKNIIIKKGLFQNIINYSALARKIAQEHNLKNNIDAILSAIRRYDCKQEKKREELKLQQLIEDATVSSKTKLCSLLLKKNDEVRKQIAQFYPQIDFAGGELIQIFEVSKYIKIILDEKNLEKAKKILGRNIQEEKKHLTEISINYTEDITKIPGVFSAIANELAIHEISIIDSMICHKEHILITDEKDFKKTFNVILALTN